MCRSQRSVSTDERAHGCDVHGEPLVHTMELHASYVETRHLDALGNVESRERARLSLQLLLECVNVIEVHLTRWSEKSDGIGDWTRMERWDGGSHMRVADRMNEVAPLETGEMGEQASKQRVGCDVEGNTQP